LDTARSKLRVLSEEEFNRAKSNQEELEDGNLKNFFREKIRDFQKNH
jgi:hypothetical protein